MPRAPVPVLLFDRTRGRSFVPTCAPAGRHAQRRANAPTARRGERSCPKPRAPRRTSGEHGEDSEHPPFAQSEHAGRLVAQRDSGLFHCLIPRGREQQEKEMSLTSKNGCHRRHGRVSHATLRTQNDHRGDKTRDPGPHHSRAIQGGGPRRQRGPDSAAAGLGLVRRVPERRGARAASGRGGVGRDGAGQARPAQTV